MKIKIKNFCGIFATLFVTTTMVLLASCSQDDDYYDSDMYTLAEMGTRLGGEPEIYDNGIEQNTYIPGEENCCGLYTLIARWRDMYGRQAFMNDGIHTPLNAKDMYEKMKAYTIAHPELQWTPDSAAMPLSTIMTLAEVFKVDGKPLFSKMVEFNSLESVQEYLSSSGNRNKVKAVVMEELKPNGKTHIAHVRVYKDRVVFEGYNYVYDEYVGGEVYYKSVMDKEGNPEKGKDCNNQPYKIIGVLLQ